jgi:hypothetical protein
MEWTSRPSGRTPEVVSTLGLHREDPAMARASCQIVGLPGGHHGPAEKAQAPRTQVQEVASDQAGVRVFVVQSEERLAYERT